MTETVVVVVVALTLALLVTAAVPALGVVAAAVGEGPDDACCLSGDK